MLSKNTEFICHGLISLHHNFCISQTVWKKNTMQVGVLVGEVVVKFLNCKTGRMKKYFLSLSQYWWKEKMKEPVSIV